MIKWVECQEGDYFYEFFLPEHEEEGAQWCVRLSACGHILGERRGLLTWIPRFGPDAGDVAAAEAATVDLAKEFATTALPTATGTYVPSSMTLPPVDPVTHALLHGLIHEFVEAEQALNLTPDQISKYLELPVVSGAQGLHPFAVTSDRDRRMQRMIALTHVLKNHPETAARKDELIQAVLAEDIPTLKRMLNDFGLPAGPDESTGE